MSAFSLSNLFRNTPAAPAPAPQQQNPVAPGASLNLANPNQPNPQQPQTQSQTQNSSNSPLDEFAKLWETKPEDGKNASQDPFAAPLFSASPDKIREAASQIDFMQQIPQELMGRVLGGNDPQAIVEMMNQVVQNAVGTTMQLTAATVEQAGSKLGQRFNSAIPGRFKDLQIESTPAKNPVLSNPAAQPLLKFLRNQVKMTNPDYSPEQVNAEAERYLTTFGSSLMENDPQVVEARQKAPASPDQQNWEAWIDKSSI
jgi:hypothetical protein